MITPLNIFYCCKKSKFLKVLTHNFVVVTLNFLWRISTFSINITFTSTVS